MSDEHVFRLVYKSVSTIPTNDAEQLGEIFNTARQHNKQKGITGALMVSNGNFAQTLEGEEEHVRELFDRIREDSRHTDVVELTAAGGQPRLFGRWAMAKVSEDGQPDIRLLSNPKHGKIVEAGAGNKQGDEQEAHLSVMRDAITS